MNKNTSPMQYHQVLIQDLYQHCSKMLTFSPDSESRFMERLEALSQCEQHSENFIAEGQALLLFVIANYPEITPLVSRDLFWFFGGDCLHYMTDEEISLYQQLDELIYETEENGTKVDYLDAKSKIFQLH